MAAEPSRDAAFSADSFRFLRELALHNDRDWFNTNKSRYLETVQAPSLPFVRAVGPKLVRVSSHLVADPRPVGGSVMRIYRDTRFAKDKSPYRTSIGIHFMHDASQEGDESLPGFFLHIAPGDSWVYAGVWRPERARLDQIRGSIVKRPAAWGKVRKALPEIEGESLKRPPAGIAADHPYVDDLKRKGFTSGSSLTDAQVIGPGFPDRFAAACRALDPLNRFLSAAMSVPY